MKSSVNNEIIRYKYFEELNILVIKFLKNPDGRQLHSLITNILNELSNNDREIISVADLRGVSFDIKFSDLKNAVEIILSHPKKISRPWLIVLDEVSTAGALGQMEYIVKGSMFESTVKICSYWDEVNNFYNVDIPDPAHTDIF